MGVPLKTSISPKIENKIASECLVHAAIILAHGEKLVRAKVAGEFQVGDQLVI